MAEFASATADPDHRQPAERTQQTAAALSDEFEIDRQLAPGAPRPRCWPQPDGPGTGRSRSGRPSPTLGMAAALLIAGEPMPWSIKKGAIWWLGRRVRGSIRNSCCAR